MASKVDETYATKAVQSLPIVNYGEPLDEKKEKWLRELVTVEFRNLEQPMLNEKFTYGDTKNKKTFTFWPGQVYKVPRFIQRHMETRGRPLWDWRPNGAGHMVKHRASQESRFQMREVFA